MCLSAATERTNASRPYAFSRPMDIRRDVLSLSTLGRLSAPLVPLRAVGLLWPDPCGPARNRRLPAFRRAIFHVATISGVARPTVARITTPPIAAIERASIPPHSKALRHWYSQRSSHYCFGAETESRHSQRGSSPVCCSLQRSPDCPSTPFYATPPSRQGPPSSAR